MFVRILVKEEEVTTPEPSKKIDKKRRLVFNDLQKKTLEAIYEVTDRPTNKMLTVRAYN